MRDDIGKLWENFWISERLKFASYHSFYANYYFWRTYDQKEIDLIEEKDGFLNAFELKYGKKKTKIPHIFAETYKNSKFNIITPDNYIDFLT
ncbi:MAG: DUF4143 domain-containing protein, partial [Chlorobi bacterium]|nr:DUF4143 domain-containing protein [Chlorobiota bacterium]